MDKELFDNSELSEDEALNLKLLDETDTTPIPLDGLNSHPESHQATLTDLYLIDTSVPDYDDLMNEVPEDKSIEFIPAQTGLAGVTEILSKYSDLKTIHLMTGGAYGELSIGPDTVSEETLDRYSAEINSWKCALAEGGEILLYSSEVYESEAGPARRISRLVIDSLGGVQEKGNLKDSTLKNGESDDITNDMDEIFFIESSIEDAQGLIDQLKDVCYIIQLDDGGSLEQVNNILSHYKNLESINFITHGDDDKFLFDGERIDIDYIRANSDTFIKWGNALSNTGDINIYSCLDAISDNKDGGTTPEQPAPNVPPSKIEEAQPLNQPNANEKETIGSAVVNSIDSDNAKLQLASQLKIKARNSNIVCNTEGFLTNTSTNFIWRRRKSDEASLSDETEKRAEETRTDYPEPEKIATPMQTEDVAPEHAVTSSPLQTEAKTNEQFKDQTNRIIRLAPPSPVKDTQDKNTKSPTAPQDVSVESSQPSYTKTDTDKIYKSNLNEEPTDTADDHTESLERLEAFEAQRVKPDHQFLNSKHTLK